jgi:hypothetical protein
MHYMCWVLVMIVPMARPVQMSGEDRIELVKGQRASALEAGLPDGTFGEWIMGVLGPEASAQWEVADHCDLRPGYVEPAEGHPVCVRFDGVLANKNLIRIMILVDYSRKHIVNKPRIDSILVTYPDEKRTIRHFSRLSEVPLAISSTSPGKTTSAPRK